jgi:hypothetical protein
MPSSNPGANSSSGNSWGLPGLPDPGQWVQQALSAAFTAIASGLLSGLRNILDWAMGLHTSSFNFISLTPPGGTYQSASVVTLWRWALGVMDAALAVIAMWGGYNALLRHQIGALPQRARVPPAAGPGRTGRQPQPALRRFFHRPQQRALRRHRGSEPAGLRSVR